MTKPTDTQPAPPPPADPIAEAEKLLANARQQRAEAFRDRLTLLCNELKCDIVPVPRMVLDEQGKLGVVADIEIRPRG